MCSFKFGYVMRLTFSTFGLNMQRDTVGSRRTQIYAWDPYQILGVSRGATAQDIRKSYKQLAKEWHPDKNKDPLAENKFVEINKAYETLILMWNRSYDKSVLPNSYKQPQIILIYSEWSMACVQALPLWKRLVEELEPIGFSMGTVSLEKESDLARQIGTKSSGDLPQLVCVMDGRPAYYKDHQFSVIKTIEFIRGRFPRKLISPIDDSNVDEFLDGWVDNRIRVLLFGKLDLIRLRYLALAYFYNSRATFGYVKLGESNAESTLKRFNILTHVDSLLLFQEDSTRASARLSMADLPFKTMKDVVESNKYLQLPRLSSQSMLDALCPPETSRLRRRLCVVLVTREEAEDVESARKALRQFVRTHFRSGKDKDRLAFAYIYGHTQQEFVTALSKSEDSPFEPHLHVVIVWRQDTQKISYRWLREPWASNQDNWNSSEQLLKDTLLELLGSTQALPYHTLLKELVDEHAQGLFSRIATRIVSACDLLKDHIQKEDMLAALSVIATLFFIAGMGYVMSYVVKLEEEKVQKQNKDNNTNQGAKDEATKLSRGSMELKLHEMRAETYNGMVRLIKPGCRTIILLTDNETRKQLIPPFHRAVWPYRKNKSLMFGWLSLERGLGWYSRLLALALHGSEASTAELQILRPRNCVGTVLALNGHRKYFCIYHAKHPETQSQGARRMEHLARRLTNKSGGQDGAFMGFESSSDESDNSDVERGTITVSDQEPLVDKEGAQGPTAICAESLLDGLPNWLDRLFEGTTQRYPINYWPDVGFK
nr:EOG090X049L [Lepidurus arcticus]